jgi:hypothetical protein
MRNTQVYTPEGIHSNQLTSRIIRDMFDNPECLILRNPSNFQRMEHSWSDLARKSMAYSSRDTNHLFVLSIPTYR